MNETYPSSDFDDWAATYDESVSEGSGFPFEEYASMLDTIVRLAPPEPDMTVLDLGIGTGNLAQRYTDCDCRIWGLDYSEKMLEICRRKIQAAVLANVDLRRDWPAEFDMKYDRVVSAFTFHHFVLQEKVDLVQRIMKNYLAHDGALVIGDVAFLDAEAQKKGRRRVGSGWEQEEYWLVDETISAFHDAGINLRFTLVSYCTGVFHFGSMVSDV